MKGTRKIIRINEELCNGCGQCVPSCFEQALQLVDTPNGKKARLVNEIHCDGLGACLGTCPTGALTIEERDADAYDEKATVERIRDVAPEMLESHQVHMREHGMPVLGEKAQYTSQGANFGGCPSARAFQWNIAETGARESTQQVHVESELRQWPVQLHLVPPFAPYFKNADLCIVADCVPFSYANFHHDFVKDRAIAIGCPKLDDVQAYIQKITDIIKVSTPRTIEVVIMEVPCCYGMVQIVSEALKRSGLSIPFKTTVVTIKGGIRREQPFFSHSM